MKYYSLETKKLYTWHTFQATLFSSGFTISSRYDGQARKNGYYVYPESSFIVNHDRIMYLNRDSKFITDII